MKGIKCPFFMRRVSSYRFYGVKCSARFDHGETIGDLQLWSKEKRENKIKEHCNDCYKQCHLYQTYLINRGLNE